jgi:hypothetical protein
VNRFTDVERAFGGFDAGKGRLQNPSRLEIGPKDHVYVQDGPRVLVFDNFGNFLHELAEGVFSKPFSLFADNEGVVVLDATMCYCFDAEERPAATIPASSFPGGESKGIQSVVLSAGKLYLLTSEGLMIVPDPRPHNAESPLDKETKSR